MTNLNLSAFSIPAAAMPRTREYMFAGGAVAAVVAALALASLSGAGVAVVWAGAPARPPSAPCRRPR